MAIDAQEFVRQFAAMQLILLITPGDGTYPNIEYVRSNATPPDGSKLSAADRQVWLNYLQDQFLRIDPAVYRAFYQTLTSVGAVEGNDVDYDWVQNAAYYNVTILQRVDPDDWDDPPPHPTTDVVRGAVDLMLQPPQLTAADIYTMKDLARSGSGKSGRGKKPKGKVLGSIKPPRSLTATKDHKK